MITADRHKLKAMIEIYDTDTWKQAADKIWSDGFVVDQSCSIFGIEFYKGDAWGKGELVVKELERLDKDKNVMIGASGKKMRKRKFIPGSIGGYIAHKIFRYKEHRIIDPTGVKGNTVKMNIWRAQ